ncbi:ATP-dependent DNA helicase DDX11-like [Rhopilema esculentum]|uniref:ATP-dependent DNA helicase DDX11-like n=1 Tax=Rhopilema esculentum TaxID=499914 RepID=UPI0031DF8694
MDKDENVEELDTPGYFPFPFPPYDIQENFMKKLYTTVEAEKVGIFESPTGTGKSLSLICGILTWLRDHDFKLQKEAEEIMGTGKITETVDKSKAPNNEPSWVNEYEEKQAKRQLAEKIDRQKAKLEKNQAKLEKLKKEREVAAAARNKRKREDSVAEDAKEGKSNNKEVVEDETEDDDDELVLSDYNSDGDEKDPDKSSSENETDSESEEDCASVKIFYCSRTHSQLAQFVNEVKKSPFGKEVKVVSLGSRQNLCINEQVQNLRSNHRINERCLELQRLKNDKKANKERKKRRKLIGNGCKYYQKKKMKDFVDNVFVDVHDIEQLVQLGQDLATCPYYGTRHSVPQAQLVVLPYNTLLHKATRDAIGIKLKNSVVIVDEAHNLIDTINSLHSIEVSGLHISTSRDQLSQYLTRYRSRLKSRNLLHINQLLLIMDLLMKFLGVAAGSKSHYPENGKKGEQKEASLYTINDFVFSTNIDNLNLFKIRRYCEKSLISKKLNGFVDKYSTSVGCMENELEATRTSQFYHIEAFLDALTNANKDGRILVVRNELLSQSKLKFLLLNPAVHFADITKEARAVIIAGGTMQPVSEFKEVLLHSAGVPLERITEFSCGHVIPPENLVAIALSKGPSSLDLDFTYQSRDQNNMIEELGRLLVNICAVVPAGIVCFFPSYDYEERVHAKWLEKGILQRIESRKKVFREPRKSGRVDQVLGNYAEFIKRTKHVRSPTGKPQQNGALLLSVVGGKMSEGINFSDDLGRCILMVGLPYPNRTSPELNEKMAYLDKCVGPKAGQEHYENICMKAVNQSIGRAIRHRSDFACIVLLDQRYSRSHVQAKLPSWIRSRLQTHPRFGPAFAAVNKFFVDKRENP